MKPAILKKVREIKGRVRDLKASFIVAIKAAEIDRKDLKSQDERLIPRVTGLVIREGNWLVRLVTRVAEKGEYKFEEKEQEKLTGAEVFFGELAEVHAEEIKKNGFIYRIDADFITYMEFLVLAFERINAQIAARVAAVATLDDDEQDDAELAAEIAAEMTA